MAIYNERDFDKFVGETIVRVDTSCINVIHFHTESGKIISVDAEEKHCTTPVISVNDWSK